MKQSGRNIPVSMVCHTMDCGQIKPLKFKIKHKDGSDMVYAIKHTEKVEQQRHSGVKTIFFYSVITINKTDYDVAFRFTPDTCKWELSRVIGKS